MRRNENTIPFSYEEDAAPATDHITLTYEQCLELTLMCCTRLNGKLWYNRKRVDSVLQINGSLRPGEIIAESNSAVYILSPNQKESLSAPKPLSIPEHVLQEEKIKDNYFKDIMSRVPVR
jgi:hypothetical protein